MYIRKIFKKDPKTKKTYTTFHLVESVRTEKGPRQRVLLYMGSKIDLPEEQHKLLAACIQDMIQGEQVFIPYPEEVEKTAQFYASQIIDRLSKNTSCKHSKKKLEPEFVNVNVHSVVHSEPRSVGGEHLMLEMANQLKLSKHLIRLGFSKTDSACAIGLIIARALHPSSEREAYRWLCTSSGLGEILGFNFKKISIDKIYQVGDTLLRHKDALEVALEQEGQKFHGYTSSIALYDLTNTYMEGQAKKNPKAAYGRSKEKRNDRPLITLGLVVNEHGFLSKTSFLPGNAAEPHTLQSMIEDLSVHQSLFKPTIILDGGIATEKNLSWLRQKGYRYIVSARQRAPLKDFEKELCPVGDKQNLVKAAVIQEDGNEEKWLYCESEAKAAVASSMKKKFMMRFEEDLENLAKGLSQPRKTKKHAKVLERIGRLKEKHKRISECYEIEAIASEDGLITTAIKWKLLEEKIQKKLTGQYFLRTNCTESDVKELWHLYNVLRGIEDVFRFMKSSLGLRPVYHRKECRVDGHLWITVLAYHLIQHCTYQLARQTILYQWKTLRNIMMTRVRVTMQAKTKEGRMLYYRSTTKAEGEQVEIYKALGLSHSILRGCKTIV